MPEEGIGLIGQLDFGSAASVALSLGALITFLVGALKTVRPTWTKGKEPYLALGLGLVSVCVLKLAKVGYLAAATWFPELVGIYLSSVIASGLLHDKVTRWLKPLLSGLKGLAQEPEATKKKK